MPTQKTRQEIIDLLNQCGGLNYQDSVSFLYSIPFLNEISGGTFDGFVSKFTGQWDQSYADKGKYDKDYYAVYNDIIYRSVIDNNINIPGQSSNWRAVGSLGESSLKGQAFPSDNPGIPLQSEYWFAEPGVYPNFGNTTIGASFGFLIFNKDSGTWSGLNVSINLDSYLKKTDLTTIINLANPANIIEGYDIRSDNGGLLASAGMAFIVVDGILPNTDYYFKTMDQTDVIRINQYRTSDDAWLPASIESANGEIKFTTNATEVGRIRVSFHKVAPGFSNRIMLNLGNGTAYAPYGIFKAVDTNTLDNYFKYKTAKINLFLFSKRHLGEFINTAGTILTGLSTTQYSRHNIPNIKGNTKYEYSGDSANDRITVAPNLPDNSVNQSTPRIVFRNNSGTVLGIWDRYNGKFGAFTSFPIVFTTPAGTTNIDIATMQDGIDQTDYFLLKEGDELTKHYSEFSSVVGKNVLYAGDSVTYLNRHQPFIAEKLKNNWVNDGVSGSWTIPGYENVENDGIRRASLVERIEAISQFLPDVIVIQTGFNDARPNIPLGVIEDEINPSFNSDGTVIASSVVGATFYGSFKYVLRRAMQLNPLSRVLVVNSHYTTASNVYDLRLGVSNAILEVSRLYRLPCLNQYQNSGINDYTLSTYTADTLHLNENGGKLYAERMIPFINGHLSES